MKNVLNLCKCNVQGGAEYSSQVIYDGGSVECIPDLVGENLSVVLERIGGFVCGLGIQMITTNEFEPSNEFGKDGDIHIREQEESIDLYQKLNGEWTLIGSFPIGGGGGGVGDFVTIDTDQFGLTGTKEWQGRHYFENALAIPRQAPTDPLPDKVYIYVGPGSGAIPPEAFGNLEDLQNVASPIPVNKFLYKGLDGIWVGVDVPGQDLSAYASKVWVGDNFYSKEISDGLFVTQATDQFDMPGNKGWTGRHHFDGSLAIPQAAPIAPDPTKAYIYVGAGSGATPPSGSGNLEDLQNVDDVIANNKFLYKGSDGIWVGSDGPISQLYQPAIGQVGIIGGNTISLNTVNTSGNQGAIAGNKTWTGVSTFGNNVVLNNSIIQTNRGGSEVSTNIIQYGAEAARSRIVARNTFNNNFASWWEFWVHNTAANVAGEILALELFRDGTVRSPSLSGTGNGIVGVNAGGTLIRRPESDVIQTLSLGTDAGNIAISGGNSVQLSSLSINSLSDFNSGFLTPGLYPIHNSGVNIGYPTTAGAGLRRQRSTGISASDWEIWKANSGSGKLMFNRAISGTAWNGWETFASEEWANAQGWFTPGMIIERFRDPSFKFGDNNIIAYPNSTGTAISRITDSTSPTGMSMRYTATGWAQANVRITFAGMSVQSAALKVFTTRMIAKIPVGWKIQDQHNAGGTGATAEWLTDNAGTGAFKEYLFKYTCGVGGSFGLVNHFDLRKVSAATPNPSSANPVVSYLAFAVVTDQTESTINTRLRIPTTPPDYPLPGDMWVG